MTWYNAFVIKDGYAYVYEVYNMQDGNARTMEPVMVLPAESPNDLMTCLSQLMSDVVKARFYSSEEEMDKLCLIGGEEMIQFMKLVSNAQAPGIQRTGDAGIDLHSIEGCTLYPGQRQIIATGIACAIPTGYVGLIMDRSGLACISGLTVLGGVIDSNYRGELKVILLNTGDSHHTIKKGDRIAQMVVIPVLCNTEVVDSLDETNRGSDGFGSSGR